MTGPSYPIYHLQKQLSSGVFITSLIFQAKSLGELPLNSAWDWRKLERSVKVTGSVGPHWCSVWFETEHGSSGPSSTVMQGIQSAFLYANGSWGQRGSPGPMQSVSVNWEDQRGCYLYCSQTGCQRLEVTGMASL